jgi:hypothetical protein
MPQKGVHDKSSLPFPHSATQHIILMKTKDIISVRNGILKDFEIYTLTSANVDSQPGKFFWTRHFCMFPSRKQRRRDFERFKPDNKWSFTLKFRSLHPTLRWFLDLKRFLSMTNFKHFLGRAEGESSKERIFPFRWRKTFSVTIKKLLKLSKYVFKTRECWRHKIFTSLILKLL